MKKVLFMMAVLLLVAATEANALVTYGMANNFFLEFFTNMGYSSYDWRYEPLKTDKERAGLKGNVVKVVTDVIDKTGRGFGENRSDTTYYNEKGQLEKIVAPQYDYEGKISKILAPSQWVFHYSPNGQLIKYENYEDTEMAQGHEMRAHIHFMRRNDKGQLLKEEYGAYDQKGGEWKLYSNITEEWSFGYDANGILTSGKFGDFILTYKNGQLTRMKDANSDKPVTFTYDAEGRMTSVKFYSIDGMDEMYNYEDNITMSYNEQGQLTKVIKEQWETTTKWVRKKISYKTEYTITYTNDAQGNWTKAVMYAKSGKAPRSMAVTINRKIYYNNAAAK